MRSRNPPVECAALTEVEASQLLDHIRPQFHHYLDLFDEEKYPPTVYDRLLFSFANPGTVVANDLRAALIWKYGHTRKKGFPRSHKALIVELQGRWYAVCKTFHPSSEQLFKQLDTEFGNQHRYITISFLLHLLRPIDIPIIDQHNYRALNHLLRIVRPTISAKAKPSTYSDLTLLRHFMTAMLARWTVTDASTVPSERNFDRFLMMYGKALKAKRRTAPRLSRKVR